MTTLAQIVKANEEFLEELHGQHLAETEHTLSISKYPNRHLAIFTCMDTRLVDFLEPAMGLKRGEVKIIKNAGNSITSPFASVIRSLLVAIFELGVKEIMVIGHLDCGLAHSTSESLTEKMLARGISADAIKMVEGELKAWLDHFHDPVENVKSVVYQIRSNPLIPKDVPVHGLIFNPDNGIIEVVVDGYQHAEGCLN
jgi:carbonic anhydrase